MKLKVWFKFIQPPMLKDNFNFSEKKYKEKLNYGLSLSKFDPFYSFFPQPPRYKCKSVEFIITI